MNIHHIEENIKKLSGNINEETFIYDFLLSYGIPKAAITRLQKGDFNASKEEGEVLWKKKIFFKIDKKSNLLTLIDDLKREKRILKHKPMFIMVTDFKNILVLDLKVGDTLDISIKKIAKHFEFFLPLIGMEKTKIQSENPADIKAAEKLGKLYDVLLEQNHPKTDEDKHALNVFLSRLLFCFFAEDTNIFPEGIFTNSIASYTKPDGSDLKKYLEELFKILNLNNKKRKNVSGFLAEFPYVNGGLFEKELKLPQFNSRSHKIIVECGSLNWAFINPDIFGSMIQSVANPETRSDMGMHYTSVANIMKVIEPLFLNDLKNELEKAEMNEAKLQDFMKKHPKHPRIRILIKENEKKLKAFLKRIYNIRVFDPACGSGNFLIIAYKELCKLEIEIFKIWHGDQASQGLKSEVKTSQFYGIELDDFAAETAKLSLWLAEHQMNLNFEEVFGETKPTLPLESGGNIVCGNATSVDWDKACPKEKGKEIYILGNPPYRGSSLQSLDQKQEMKNALEDDLAYKNLDYIATWFYKAAKYIAETDHRVGFVSTNSICQGQQVSILWPQIMELGIEIGFAVQSFKWANHAKSNAGVVCVIVGLRKKSNAKKIIFTKDSLKKVENINAYLINGIDIFIGKRNSPISSLPLMNRGSGPVDDGNLILSFDEQMELKSKYPDSSRYIHPLYGSTEFINGSKRWCLWIEDEDKVKASAIDPIKKRLEKVAEFRLKSKKKATSEKASLPHQFGETRYVDSPCIIVPRVSSDRRKFIPVGFLDSGTVILDSAQAIYDAVPYMLSILSSTLHLVWVRATAGHLKSDYRYSPLLCYNNFPIPTLNNKQMESLNNHAFDIIEEREKYSEMTISDLYDPDRMPSSLAKKHHKLDLEIESYYRKRPFISDEDRLSHLFKLYEEMIKKEKEI